MTVCTTNAKQFRDMDLRRGYGCTLSLNLFRVPNCAFHLTLVFSFVQWFYLIWHFPWVRTLILVWKAFLRFCRNASSFFLHFKNINVPLADELLSCFLSMTALQEDWQCLAVINPMCRLQTLLYTFTSPLTMRKTPQFKSIQKIPFRWWSQ